MFRIIGLTIIVLMAVNNLFSQTAQDKIDSLERILPTVHDSDRFDVLFSLVYYYQTIDLGKTSDYLLLAYQDAVKNKDKKNQAEALRNLGTLNGYLGKNDTAIYFFNEASKMFHEMNDSNSIAITFHELGNLYWKISDYYNASFSYLSALRICEAISDTFGIAREYSSIAFIYERSGELDKALELYRKSIEYWQSNESKQGISVSISNIANIYTKQERFDEALKYHFKSVSYKDKYYLSKKDIDINYYNIGDIYIRLKQYDSAKIYLHKAKTISEHFKNIFTSAHIYHALSTLNRKLDLGDSSLFYLKKSRTFALKANNLEILRATYQDFSDYYSSIGNFDSAYQYLKKYTQLADSLLPVKARLELAAYETEKVQSQLDLLEKENEITQLNSEKRKNQRNFLIITSILLIIVALVILSRFLLKQKTNKLLKEKNAELELANQTKDKFFAIVAHDLKNQLIAFQNISSVLAENFKTIAEEKKHHLIKRINTAATSLYNVLENLLTWSSSQLKRIDYNPTELSVKSICRKTIDEFYLNAEKKKINIVCDIPKDLMIYTDENMFLTIIRNLCNNAIKFSPENSMIKIEGSQQGKNILISVADQGIGLSESDIQKLFRIDVNHKEIGTSQEKGVGLGLVITREFVAKMNGNISVTSELGKGSTFLVTIPFQNQN